MEADMLVPSGFPHGSERARSAMAGSSPLCSSIIYGTAKQQLADFQLVYSHFLDRTFVFEIRAPGLPRVHVFPGFFLLAKDPNPPGRPVSCVILKLIFGFWPRAFLFRLVSFWCWSR
jgi:hypothetical protein